MSNDSSASNMRTFMHRANTLDRGLDALAAQSNPPESAWAAAARVAKLAGAQTLMEVTWQSVGVYLC